MLHKKDGKIAENHCQYCNCTAFKNMMTNKPTNQILAVLMQENLDDDIFRVFGYKNRFQRHRNPATRADKALSELGHANLMKFFSEDFEALTRLYCWGKIKRKIFIDAMAYTSGQTLHRTAIALRSKAAGELTGWNAVPSAQSETKV